jgi:hypothetical protein
MFVGSLQGGFGRYSFPQVDANNDGFAQTRIDAQAFLEYRLSDTFGVNTSLSYDQALNKGPNAEGVRTSLGEDGALGTDDDIYDDLEYKRFQAFVGLRAFW